MKMPSAIESRYFAPCGMNCMVCYKHCAHKKPCAGCLAGDEGKPSHCRACAIKDCVREKGLSHCVQCEDYPCKRIKSLDRSYRTRYATSLIANSRAVQAQGLEPFLEMQRQAYACPKCGGVFSLHDGKCSDCGWVWEP